MAWIEQVFRPPGHRSREKMEVRSRRRSALPSVGVAVRVHPRRHRRTRLLTVLARRAQAARFGPAPCYISSLVYVRGKAILSGFAPSEATLGTPASCGSQEDAASQCAWPAPARASRAAS